MTKEDQIRSLSRNELRVLRARCQGKEHGEIAKIYDRSDKWSQGLTSSGYRKLSITSGSDGDQDEYLSRHFCKELMKFTEEEINSWPKRGWRNAEANKPDENDFSDEDDIAENDRPDLDLTIGEFLKRTESQQRQQESAVPTSSSSANEDPFVLNPPENQRINRLWIIVPVIVCLACLLVARIGINWASAIFNPTPPASQSSPTQNPTQTSIATETPRNIETSTLSPTSEPSPTPTISPTAVPFPKENFNSEISPLWESFGDPVFTTGQCRGCDGVMTTRTGATAGIAIGNVAWTDYAVLFRARWTTLQHQRHEISVRMTDVNNRIILSCSTIYCSWVVIYQGKRDVLVDQLILSGVDEGITVSVQGNTITASSNYETNNNIQLILTEPYKDKFPGGGVMLEIKDMEVDYVEIHPLN